MSHAARPTRRCDEGSVARRDRVAWKLDASTLVPVEGIAGAVDVWGVATRVGVFEYTDGPEALREYVPPDELFNVDSLATLRGVPFVVFHPDGDVTAANSRDLMHGYVLDVRPNEAEGIVDTRIRIMSADALAQIEAGTVELSCGYETVVESVPGTTPDGEAYDAIQRRRRYNHLALVDIARVGHVARLRLDGVQRTGDPLMKKIIVKLADGTTIAVPEILLAGLKAGRIDAKDSKDPKVAKARQDGLDPQEIVIAGETLIVPKATLDAVIALLGGTPGPSEEAPPEGDPMLAGEPPITDQRGAGRAAGAPALNRDDVRKMITDGIAAGLKHADAAREVQQTVRRAAGIVLPDTHDFTRDTWTLAGDAIIHVDGERKDAVEALVAKAKAGDAVAQGRLLGLLDALPQEREDGSAASLSLAIGGARHDGNETRTDSVSDARQSMIARRMGKGRKTEAAAAAK